jgi:arylsulfatase A-like enzyme
MFKFLFSNRIQLIEYGTRRVLKAMSLLIAGFFVSCVSHDCAAAAPVQQAEIQPPVVMIVLDDLFDYRRFRNRFGVKLQTPNLDRLAARGTSFTNAFCSVAVCNASRSSVLSGLSPIKTKIHQPEPIHFFDTLSVDDTLMTMMKQAGYHVISTGKVMHNSSKTADRAQLKSIHDEFFQARGRLKLPPGRVANVQASGVLSADDKHVAWASDKLKNWDGRGKPLFLSVGIVRPHRPFIAPQEFFDLYDRSAIRVPNHGDSDLEDVSSFYYLFRLVSNYARYLINGRLDKEFVHGYLASTSYADAKVGEILDAIDSNPALKNARILLWSDHGYELGDKNTWNKFTLWESSSRVPLIVVDPELPAGKTIRHSVSLLDVLPTILNWADAPIPDACDGVSLLETGARRNQTDRRAVLTTMLGCCSIRRRDMRFTLYPDGSVELYHMRIDPMQRTNLAYLPRWKPTLDSLRVALTREVKRQGGVIDPEAVSIDGSSGDDVLYVIGNQKANGGPGNDTYFVADGIVNELPGAGDDMVFFANLDFQIPKNIESSSTYPFLNDFSRRAQWKVVGNQQPNRIFVFGGKGNVHAGFGNDLIKASASADRLFGDNGRDEIHAGSGRDFIRGGQGADRLYGENGDDDLDGGTGPDVMTGGLGKDRFRFPRDNFLDIVTDFEFGSDTIWLHSGTMLHGLNLTQMAERMSQQTSTEVLIRDDDGKQMLIQNATLQQVLSSIEKE